MLQLIRKKRERDREKSREPPASMHMHIQKQIINHLRLYISDSCRETSELIIRTFKKGQNEKVN